MTRDDSQVYVVQLAAAAEQFARAAEQLDAPEGTAAWLLWLSQRMLADAGIELQ